MQHAHPTIAEVWSRFYAEKALTLRPTSIATDYDRVTRALSQCPITSAADGRAALVWALGLRPHSTAKRVATYLRAALKWAALPDVALLPQDVASSFAMPRAKGGGGEIVVVKRCEVPALLRALRPQRRRHPRDWSLLAQFMLQTGLRTGEAFALRWGDVSCGKVRVHSNMTLTHGHLDSTKTGVTRYVPLNDAALDALDALGPRGATGDYLWPGASSARVAYQSHFRRVALRLHEEGVVHARFRPYDLRHTAISRWIEGGISPTQAARWAGNSTAVIFAHYCGVTEEVAMPVV